MLLGCKGLKEFATDKYIESQKKESHLMFVVQQYIAGKMKIFVVYT